MARCPRASRTTIGHDEKEHELPAVHEARSRIGGQSRAHERQRRVSGKRPEKRAGRPGRDPRHERSDEPEKRRKAEEHLSDEQVEQRHRPGWRPATSTRRVRWSRRARARRKRRAHSASSKRSAAARTVTAEMPVRQRKSPGTQTRCSQGRHGRVPASIDSVCRRRRTPRRRSFSERRTVQTDDRHVARRRDMKRTAVAADEQRRAVHRGPQFRERQPSALTRRTAAGPAAARARSITRRAASRSEGPPVISTHRSDRGRRRDRLPAPTNDVPASAGRDCPRSRAEG